MEDVREPVLAEQLLDELRIDDLARDERGPGFGGPSPERRSPGAEGPEAGPGETAPQPGADIAHDGLQRAGQVVQSVSATERRIPGPGTVLDAHPETSLGSLHLDNLRQLVLPGDVIARNCIASGEVTGCEQ